MATHKQNFIRIGIDGGAYDPGLGVRSGIERLMTGFLEELPNYLTDKKIFYYGFANGIDKLNGVDTIIRRLPERLFSSLFLPVALITDRINLYLGFSGVIPPLLRLFKKKTIVFIHDFAFLDHPENYGNPDKMKWQTEYALFGAERVVVFSDYIEKQVFNRFPKLSREKVIRIYPGGDHLGTPEGTLPDRNDPYFLYVGVIKPAKNILALLSRFEKYARLHDKNNTRLILVGPQEKAYFESIKKTLVYHKLAGKIEFKTDINDTKLKQLYQKSMGLLNISHDEGFCYPVIEALELGKPAIVSDIPLYEEFLPYYNRLTISKTEDDFILALKQVSDERAYVQKPIKSPFKWHIFTKKLMSEIDKLYL